MPMIHFIDSRLLLSNGSKGIAMRNNIYFSDDHWNAMRDGLAAFLIDPLDSDDDAMVEQAKAEAAEVMANAGVVPESCRADIEAQAA